MKEYQISIQAKRNVILNYGSNIKDFLINPRHNELE